MEVEREDPEICARVIDSLKRQIYETKKLINNQINVGKSQDLMLKRKMDQSKARMAVKSLILKKQKHDITEYLEESQKQ